MIINPPSIFHLPLVCQIFEILGFFWIKQFWSMTTQVLLCESFFGFEISSLSSVLGAGYGKSSPGSCTIRLVSCEPPYRLQWDSQRSSMVDSPCEDSMATQLDIQEWLCFWEQYSEQPSNCGPIFQTWRTTVTNAGKCPYNGRFCWRQACWRSFHTEL